MDVAELVESIDAAEHFGDIEAGVTVVEDAGVVEESAEVATWDVFLDSVLVWFLSSTKNVTIP